MNIEEYKQQLEAHDWFYYFSDDHGVWERGESESGRVFGIAKSGSDEHKRAYNEAHAKRFHTDSFPKPWAFPFPNLTLEPQPEQAQS